MQQSGAFTILIDYANELQNMISNVIWERIMLGQVVPLELGTLIQNWRLPTQKTSGLLLC